MFCLPVNYFAESPAHWSSNNEFKQKRVDSCKAFCHHSQPSYLTRVSNKSLFAQWTLKKMKFDQFLRGSGFKTLKPLFHNTSSSRDEWQYFPNCSLSGVICSPFRQWHITLSLSWKNSHGRSHPRCCWPRTVIFLRVPTRTDLWLPLVHLYSQGVIMQWPLSLHWKRLYAAALHVERTKTDITTFILYSSTLAFGEYRIQR